MSKLTLEERRITALRRQLYGTGGNKKSGIAQPNLTNSENRKISLPLNLINQQNNRQLSSYTQNIFSASETTFLRQDLTKIFYLSIFALCIQLLLHWSLNIKIISLGF